MKTSEYICKAIDEKMQLDKLTDSQSKLTDIIDIGFKKSFEPYFKQLMLVQNRIDFTTKVLLKQQDIFMYYVKVPQTEEELILSVVPHPITEKAEKVILKELHKMKSNKKELEDEQ